MSATSFQLPISCDCEGTETDFSLKISRKTTIPELLELVMKRFTEPIQQISCLFPTGTYVRHTPYNGKTTIKSSSELPSESPCNEEDLPVYSLTHGCAHAVRVRVTINRPIDLTVELPASQTINVQVLPTITVHELLEQLQKLPEVGKKLDNLRPYYKNTHLMDSWILHDFGISTKSTLVMRVPHGEVPITFLYKLGTSERVMVDLSATERELKQIVMKLFHIDQEYYDQLAFDYRGVFLEECSLSDYGIDSDSVIVVCESFLGGTPMSFVDVQSDAPGAIVDISFSDDAPPWRCCRSGINIEGKCPNTRCKAHNKMVISKQGFGLFDLMTSEAKCPLCRTKIVPIKPGFTDCVWRVVSMKTDGSYHQTPWRRIEDKYQTYDEVKAGMATFNCLQIEAKPLDREFHTSQEEEEEKKTKKTKKEKKEKEKDTHPVLVVPERCSVCEDELAVSSPLTLLPCGHGMHSHCLEHWTHTHHTHCPLCSAPLINILPPPPPKHQQEIFS